MDVILEKLKVALEKIEDRKKQGMTAVDSAEAHVVTMTALIELIEAMK